jgi:hypothetical protein
VPVARLADADRARGATGCARASVRHRNRRDTRLGTAPCTTALRYMPNCSRCARRTKAALFRHGPESAEENRHGAVNPAPSLCPGGPAAPQVRDRAASRARFPTGPGGGTGPHDSARRTPFRLRPGRRRPALLRGQDRRFPARSDAFRVPGPAPRRTLRRAARAAGEPGPGRPRRCRPAGKVTDFPPLVALPDGPAPRPSGSSAPAPDEESTPAGEACETPRTRGHLGFSSGTRRRRRSRPGSGRPGIPNRTPGHTPPTPRHAPPATFVTHFAHLHPSCALSGTGTRVRGVPHQAA